MKPSTPHRCVEAMRSYGRWSLRWRRDGIATLLADEIAQAIGVIGAISEHLTCGKIAHTIAGQSHVVLLTRSEHETHQQAKRIDYGVDLGPEASARAAESPGRRSPVLICPPAASACARTTVASIESHSKSA